MRRGAVVVLAWYLRLALGNKLVERMGRIRSACAQD